MGVENPKLLVPLNAYCQDTLTKLSERYGLKRTRICRIALEAGLRQISVPSGAPAGVALPIEEGT